MPRMHQSDICSLAAWQSKEQTNLARSPAFGRVRQASAAQNNDKNERDIANQVDIRTVCLLSCLPSSTCASEQLRRCPLKITRQTNHSHESVNRTRRDSRKKLWRPTSCGTVVSNRIHQKDAIRPTHSKGLVFLNASTAASFYLKSLLFFCLILFSDL